MDDFTITSRMTTKEYAKVMIIGLYKKPVFILAAFLGIYLILDDASYLEAIMGFFLFLSPMIITLIAVSQFNSNPSFKNDIKFIFGENGIHVEGITFKAQFTWEHIIKQKEISHFIILYHSKKMGNFVDKTKLTPDQLKFIKDKVGGK
jgi:hypothetical protein